ncbi:hypothetical protein D3C85_796390 [compost metagenome]
MIEMPVGNENIIGLNFFNVNVLCQYIISNVRIEKNVAVSYLHCEARMAIIS